MFASLPQGTVVTVLMTSFPSTEAHRRSNRGRFIYQERSVTFRSRRVAPQDQEKPDAVTCRIVEVDARYVVSTLEPYTILWRWTVFI
ncbi:hypothetical protein BDM02DRAFT_3006172 [Thelephora ganbajun]|uniref:Uncharacterized protein n=1 Tax=Thelephora ganbajun TaxID=370292 RepID=A0ACB6ZAU6_THEGA|nr:hypothetical protein BDM02DRAFT_3006172 [Thelephora ganbajun]